MHQLLVTDVAAIRSDPDASPESSKGTNEEVSREEMPMYGGAPKTPLMPEAQVGSYNVGKF